MRTYRRSLALLWSFVLLAGNGTHPQLVQAQRFHLDPFILEILKVEASFRRFHQDQAEYQRSRDRERLSIPAYNIQLSRAVAAFHQHIQDMHHRHVDCRRCRHYVSQIKGLVKRIDSGMK